MGLPDAAGTLSRHCYLGQTSVNEGASDVTITLPGGARDAYLFKAMPNWNTEVYEYSHGAATVVVCFATPAPANAVIRWGLWTA